MNPHARPASRRPAPARHALTVALAAALALGCAAAAQASEAGPQAPDGAAPLAAAVAVAGAVELDAVQVTARRRVESVQDVPTPITVVAGQDLERNGVYQLQDLQQLLPSTNAAFWNPRQSAIAVRGIGNNPANDGLEASVGLVLDNVVLGRPGMAVFDLLDLEQVELLRGPQGTLFGKNTTAGVLNISSRQPTFEPEHSIDVSAGQRGYYQLKATASDGLTDTVAGRISVFTTHDDGWVRNLHDGADLNSVDRQGVRGQLLVEPHDRLSVRLIADYNEQDDTQGVPLLQSIGAATPLYRPFLPAPGTDDFTTDIDAEQSMAVEQGGASAQVDYTLAGGHRFTSVTAWRFWDFRPRNDVDLSPYPIIDHAGYDVDYRQLSQELRLASPGGSRFDYVVGAFLLDQQIENHVVMDYGSHADAALIGPIAGQIRGVLNDVVSITDGRLDTRSAAVFGQGSWHLTDRLDLDAGLRLTWEDKQARIVRLPPQGGNDFAGLPPVLATTLRAIRASQTRAWDSGKFGFDDTSPSGLLGLSYRFSDDVLGYVTYAHGEKSGAINANSPTPQIAALPLEQARQSLIVDPEVADDIEIGIKSTLWDNRLQFNLNLFQTRVRDYQANALVPYTDPATGITGVTTLLTNVDSLRSSGVEWDVRAAPVDGLTLGFNGSYNDAHYESFANAPCPAEATVRPLAGCDLSGRKLNGAPRWMLNLSGDYRWSTAHGEPYLSATYSWRSDAFGNLDNSVHNVLPEYGVLNLVAGWRVDRQSHHWDVSVWARNATDEHYLLNGGVLLNTYNASAAAPRTIGATVRYGFH